jgi:LmbE family N-acetylglucosaminyl deacetylase
VYRGRPGSYLESTNTLVTKLCVRIASPHFDDAAFSVGLTINALVRGHHNVTLINCFTQSEYAPFAPYCARADVNRLRRAEDREFLSYFNGQVESVDAGRLDAPLRLRCDLHQVRRSRRLTNNDNDEAAALASVLKEDSKSLLLLPLALGCHIDHRVTLEAGFRALNGSRLFGFYEDLPYAAELRECCIQSAVARVSRLLRTVLLPVLIPHDSELVSKAMFMRIYKSQISDAQVAKTAEYERHAGGERLWITPEVGSKFHDAGFESEAIEPPSWMDGSGLCIFHRVVDGLASVTRRAWSRINT